MANVTILQATLNPTNNTVTVVGEATVASATVELVGDGKTKEKKVPINVQFTTTFTVIDPTGPLFATAEAEGRSAGKEVTIESVTESLKAWKSRRARGGS